jgi:hypothetical protein
MGRFFVCLVVCIRKGFAPGKVAQLGHGGFLMLEYQKSSAAAPKPRNWFRVEIFLAGVFAMARGGLSRRTARTVFVEAALAYQQSRPNFCKPQSVGGGSGQVTISGTPA